MLFKSFSRLADLPDDPDWLWEGLLAPGSLTMLSGATFGGKSTLVAALLRALHAGEPFLGLPTRPASAVLVSEEDDQVLRSRAARFDLLAVESAFASRTSGVLAEDWARLVALATDAAVNGGHRLLVIDTFPGLANLADEQENDAAAITRRLRPLQAAAGVGIAVLFLHHLNDRGQPRGAKAFRGVSDCSIRLLRRRNESRFLLDVESRFASAPRRVIGRLVKSEPSWTFLAEQSRGHSDETDTFAEEHPQTASTRRRQNSSGGTQERILRTLARSLDGMTYAELAEAGISADASRKTLPKLLGDKVGRNGRGGRRDPYRWYLIPSDDVPCRAPP